MTIFLFIVHLMRCVLSASVKRDFSDATVLRYMGVGLAQSLIAYGSTLKGVGKLQVLTRCILYLNILYVACG